eukprot:scaffold3134_cov414-Prasinococcus_capsulatus_cf.AAC.35
MAGRVCPEVGNPYRRVWAVEHCASTSLEAGPVRCVHILRDLNWSSRVRPLLRGAAARDGGRAGRTEGRQPSTLLLIGHPH